MNRRQSLRLIAGAIGAVALPAVAADADPAAVTAPVRAFYATLQGVMRRAKALGVKGRFDVLAPVIPATFDIAAMTRIAVGVTWSSIAAEQQAALVDAFGRMTTATYANRFDGYSGERFEVDPEVETRRSGSVVHTRLVQSSGIPIPLNYLMRVSPTGWKIVDVYLAGAISELATRRAEFATILDSGGPPLLVDTLKQQADKLLQSSAAN